MLSDIRFHEFWQWDDHPSLCLICGKTRFAVRHGIGSLITRRFP
jgi:hypothetical protein